MLPGMVLGNCSGLHLICDNSKRNADVGCRGTFDITDDVAFGLSFGGVSLENTAPTYVEL